MENAVIAMISMAIVLSGTLTLMLGSIPVVDTLSSSWKEMTQLAGEMKRTEIITDNCTVLDAGAQIQITIRNEGQVSLNNFDSWDVIVKYTGADDIYTKWLPYTSSPPENNKWSVEGIYFNGSPETIEPNILNSGEDMKIVMQLDPQVEVNSTNQVTISTPNGVITEAIFQRGGT